MSKEKDSKDLMEAGYWTKITGVLNYNMNGCIWMKPSSLYL